VKVRSGERRANPRFDIVGVLEGAVESLRRHRLRNIGTHGALFEADRWFAAGARFIAHLVDQGGRRMIGAEVKWVAADRDLDGKPQYLVGIAWVEPPVSVTSAAGLEAPGDLEAVEAAQMPGGRERRMAPRQSCLDEWILEIPLVTTVTVVDVSAGGALLLSPRLLEPGTRGLLSIRLAADNFSSDVDVRRSLERAGTTARWLLGVQFLAMSERSRQGLEGLLRKRTDVQPS
jgi:hypothetical protein